jgi:phage terminase small subunit
MHPIFPGKERYAMTKTTVTKDDAGKAFDLFCAKYQIKYEKAVACLKKTGTLC